ncbi:MAG: glucose 1-dehydrogenase [Pseudomonadota bacterium]|uniref:glucose 1-dehydrogenase n=1 Tax=Thermithiobacillus tepidarius TaxID=929 RepID=UPI0004223841|nr:glucose 1-dehydrogenase [Thermithiobacillus tepidarius]
MHLNGKVAIVTGGGQGIGKAIARHCLERGLKVVIAEADAEAGQETAAELAALGDIRCVAADVAREEDVQRTVREAVDGYGRLDYLVNNAGIMIRKPVTELSLAEWRRVLDVNLSSVFLGAKHAAPFLRERRGAIVNIASTRGLMSEPATEAYSASKGGIIALTHALAVSLGPAVRVNCVSPGWIEAGDWKKRSLRHPVQLREEDHRQHPAGRVGRPEDVASLVLYLLSDEAGFVTGADFVVDGGMTRKMIYVE